MKALFLGGWQANELFSALCWTFLHSLWQGMIAAILAGIVIISTRKSPAVVRYNLLGAILIVFLVSAAVTFFLQLNNLPTTLVTTVVYFDPAGSIPQNTVVVPASTGFIDTFIRFLNSNSTLIVFIWFFVFAARNIKLAADLLWVHRVRNHKVHSPTPEWRNKVSALAQSIGIKKAVDLLQSELVKVPVTVGFFKPVILLPLGLLSNLPPDQVETILLHELAHIRRKDYLVNILQSFAESVFFFNPFVLWISSVLRDEREACCDDIVIDSVRHKKSYIEALVSFQEYSLSHSPYAMALGRKKSSLLDRVKRLLTSENKKLNNMEKLILLAGITALTAFSLVPQKENTAARKPQKETVNNIAGTADTVPKQKMSEMDYKRMNLPSIKIYPSNDPRSANDQTITATDQNGKEYKLEKAHGRIISLAIDGVVVPASELARHEVLFNKIETTLKEASAAKAVKKDFTAYNNKAKEAAMQAQPAQKAKAFNKEQYLSQELESKGERNAVEKTFPANDVKKEYPREAIDKKGAVDKNPPNKKITAAKGIETDQDRVIEVINTLIQEKIVSDFNAVDWFGLTENELVVNGVKQDAALHKMLKERANIKANYGLFYGPSKLGGVGIYLDKADIPASKRITY